MNCEETGFGIRDSGFGPPATDAEKWILTRLGRTLADVEAHFATYRFDLLARALYEFTWNEFCDWFVELSKPYLHGTASVDDQSTDVTLVVKYSESVRRTLLAVLETLLRALHPIIPFITEEIWHEVAPKLGIAGDTISTRPYPRAADLLSDDAAEAEIEWLKAVLTQIRRIRSEMNIAPSKEIPVIFDGNTKRDIDRVTKYTAQIKFLARTESLKWLRGKEEPAAASAIVGSMKVLIPLAGLIDIEAEKARLAREIKRLEGELEKSNAKLAKFGPNTPAAVVDQEKQRLSEHTALIGGMREQLTKLGAL